MRLARVTLSGHPDRICDLVAAGIADEYLRRDPETRIRCNVSGGRGAIFVTGEILTTADFDVSHLVQRSLGQLGVIELLEPFIALEPVESGQVGRWRQSCTEPTLVTGYATREADSSMPAPMHWAKKLATTLDEKRRIDPDWFWLGAAGTVTVLGEGKDISEVVVEVDHGIQPLELVRHAIAQEFDALDWENKPKLQINLLGELEKQGIETSIGRSPSHVLAYGQGLPFLVNPAGRDWHAVEIYGAWLARYLAKETLRKSEAQAVMVELLYRPGETYPSRILARDEKGRDLSGLARFDREKMMEKIKDWRSPGRMTEATKAGIVGDRHLPWENA